MTDSNEHISTATLEAALTEVKNTEKGKRGRKPLSAEERASRAERRAEFLATNKAARIARKAARIEQRKAAKPNKLDRVANSLPELSDEAKQVIASIPVGEESAVAQHLQFSLRAVATAKSSDADLAVGQLVRVNGGHPKFVGALAKVTDVRRIRCYVQLLDSDRVLYLLLGDVEPISDDEASYMAEDTELFGTAKEDVAV